MTRVFHLVISLAPGGLERLVVDWTNARNKADPGSTNIICLDELGGLSGQVRRDAEVICVHAKRTRWPFDVVAVWRLRALLKGCIAQLHDNAKSNSPGDAGWPIVVLHSHNAAAWQYAALSCIGLRVHHIHTEHGTNPHFEGVYNRLRTLLLRRLTDVIVAVSKSTVEDLVVRHRISRSELVVIANGVEEGERGQKVEGEGGADVRKLLGIPAEAFILGSVGRLAEVKGYDRLITALAALQKLQASIRGEENGSSVDAEGVREKGRRCILLLVGDGPERKQLEILAQELGVADRVIIAGYQPDPAPYLNAMDMFILSSRSEGLSVALLEAMAAGVPVAVTDVGENSGVIDHGGCGVVLPDEEGKWAGVLATAVADRKLTDERVEAARKRVRERYSLSATLASYERVYQG